MPSPDPLASIAGMFADRVAPAAGVYRVWIGHLARDAPRWAAMAMSGTRCSSPLSLSEDVGICNAPAMGSCVSCGQPACIKHVLVAPGAVVCGACVSLAAKARRPHQPPPDFGFRPEEPSAGGRAAQRAAFLVLGLDPDQRHSPEDIKRAYRRKAGRCHPDRARNDAERERLSAELRELNDAFSALKGAAA